MPVSAFRCTLAVPPILAAASAIASILATEAADSSTSYPTARSSGSPGGMIHARIGAVIPAARSSRASRT